jgi:hypothetical protein
MSEQIQYNYYNTVATKIGDNAFIFRGKRNSPNLVLPNSDSYVSAKLTILPNDGLIEIEHEPITNYNKRAIVRFPLKLDTILDPNVAIGASQEINLNAIISKSIRFDIDDTDNVIQLDPIENSSSVEGFCSKKDRRNLNKQISSEIDRKLDEKLNKHLLDAPHCGDCKSSGRGNGNGNGNRNGGGSGTNIRSSRFVSANFIEGFKEGNTSVTDDSGCVAKVSKEITENGYVFSTNPGTEKSIYHTAVMGVIWFVISFFLGRQIVDWFYKKQWMTFGPHTREGGRYILDRNEIIVFAILISLNVTFWGLTSYQYDKWGKHFELIAYWFTIAIFSLLYFVYETRRSITGTGDISNREKWFDPIIKWDGWKPEAILPNMWKAILGEEPTY